MFIKTQCQKKKTKWQKKIGYTIAKSAVGEEETFLYSQGSFSWSNNQIHMRKIRENDQI